MNGKQTAGIVATLLLFLVSTQAAADQAALSKKLVLEINEKVIPAYQAGKPLTMLKALSPLMARIPEDRVEAVDSLLAEHQAPTLGELLVDARVSLVQQGFAKDAPRAHYREVLLTSTAMKDRIETVLAEKEAHPALAADAETPESFEDYDDLFWKIHVLEQQLANMTRIGDYAQKMTTSTRVNRKRLTEKQLAVLDFDFGPLQQGLKSLGETLQARSTELRIERIRFAIDTIRKSDDFKQKLLAALIIDLDGNHLQKMENADEELVAQVKQTRKSFSRLVKKSRLLHSGLHWWMRGRYGRGPEGAGLLKSEQALRSPQALFGLYMPVTTPTPTDPSDRSARPIPEVDRRHHYIWLYEYRQIGDRKVETHSVSQSTRTLTSKTTMSRFY